MQLFVGLGNPGAGHARNRHNVGFMALDAIARGHGFAPWRARFRGLIAEGHVGGARVLAFKPQTFMNRSGIAVGEAARFYKIAPERVVAIHDEVDLAPGRIRVKTGGGSAGHNGLRSIDSHFGPAYRRLRIGVGHPGDKRRVPSFVLRDFSPDDLDWLEELLPALVDAAPLLARGDDAGFANRVAAARGGNAPRGAARTGAADGV